MIAILQFTSARKTDRDVRSTEDDGRPQERLDCIDDSLAKLSGLITVHDEMLGRQWHMSD